MIKKIKLILVLGTVLFFVQGCKTVDKNEDAEKLNVLFIIVDDLRVQANTFGQTEMFTPSIDRLAKEGTSFNRAYCSVPVCGASRASLLSGARPTSTRFVNYFTFKDKDYPDHPSLPKWYKDHGYTTISNGKIYHHKEDDLNAWSEEPYLPTSGIGWQSYLTEESKEIIEKNKSNPNGDLDEIVKNNYKTTDVAVVRGPAYEAADVEDNAYPDGKLADKSIEDLRRLSKQDAPFFLAVGFYKPHLPFNAPKKYWDLYDEDAIDLADNDYQPKNAPDESMHEWGELRGMYTDIPEQGNLPDNIAKKLVHGYKACVSYSDAQIGKLLDELDNLGIADNTVVVLIGDHGWHLGEHTLWCKHSNFDRVMNAPLIVRSPGKSKGETSNSITEFIDIYPSLCDLTNLPKPEHLDGASFVPVLENSKVKVKEAAFVRYHDAESVIIDGFTYTEFLEENRPVANMLYNLKTDPKENVNISEDPSNSAIVEEMSKKLLEMREKVSN